MDIIAKEVLDGLHTPNHLEPRLGLGLGTYSILVAIINFVL